MKKALLTLILSIVTAGLKGQNILIEKSLYTSPQAIELKGTSADRSSFYFSTNDDGLLIYDIKKQKVALDTSASNAFSYYRISESFNLIQTNRSELLLENTITKDTVYYYTAADSISLPKLVYNPSSDFFYGVIDSQKVIRLGLSFDGIQSIDTIVVPETDLIIEGISFFKDLTYYSATKNDSTNLYLLDSSKYVRLRYPLNFGEKTYGINILNEDSLLVTRQRRVGEHELVLLYASKIAMHPDSIKLLKTRELEKYTFDSIYTKDSVFLTETSMNAPRNTGKGRWALLVSRTTDAFKAMLTLNKLLKIEPRAYSIKKDSVYFILGPRQLTEANLKTDSIYFAENGFSSIAFDLKSDSTLQPSDVTIRLECLDPETGVRPQFRADFYEYETNTLIKSTVVQDQEVCYLSYYPELTLGLTVSSEGYLPYSKRFEPIQALKTSKRLEIIALLKSIKANEQQNFTLRNIYFDFDSHKLSAAATRELDLVLETLNKASTVHVEGHTDSVGSEEYNKALSERRARSVAEYLNDKIDKPLTTEGKGESYPVSTNQTDLGRSQNRRCEIILNRDEQQP